MAIVKVRDATTNQDFDIELASASLLQFPRTPVATTADTSTQTHTSTAGSSGQGVNGPTVYQVKAWLMANHPHHPLVQTQRLIYRGRELGDAWPIGEFLRQNESNIVHLVIRSGENSTPIYTRNTNTTTTASNSNENAVHEQAQVSVEEFPALSELPPAGAVFLFNNQPYLVVSRLNQHRTSFNFGNNAQDPIQNDPQQRQQGHQQQNQQRPNQQQGQQRFQVRIHVFRLPINLLFTLAKYVFIAYLFSRGGTSPMSFAIYILAFIGFIVQAGWLQFLGDVMGRFILPMQRPQQNQQQEPDGQNVGVLQRVVVGLQEGIGMPVLANVFAFLASLVPGIDRALVDMNQPVPEPQPPAIDAPANGEAQGEDATNEEVQDDQQDNETDMGDETAVIDQQVQTTMTTGATTSVAEGEGSSEVRQRRPNAADSDLAAGVSH